MSIQERVSQAGAIDSDVAHGPAGIINRFDFPEGVLRALFPEPIRIDLVWTGATRNILTIMAVGIRRIPRIAVGTIRTVVCKPLCGFRIS